MKKRIIITLLAIITLLFTGCNKFSYEMTILGNKITIKATAEDEKTANTDYFSVGKNQHAVVEASLDKGTLNMEFIRVTVFSYSEGPDDIVEHEVVATVKVTGTDRTTLDLEKGDYIIRVTAVGATEGTVNVTLEK